MILLVLCFLSGILFTALTTLRYNASGIELVVLFWLMFWFFYSYVAEILRLRNADPSIQKSIDKENLFERNDSYIILFLNLCTYLILWIYPSIQPVHPMDYIIAYFPFPFILVVLYWDSERFGRKIAEVECRDKHKVW